MPESAPSVQPAPSSHRTARGAVLGLLLAGGVAIAWLARPGASPVLLPSGITSDEYDAVRAERGMRGGPAPPPADVLLEIARKAVSEGAPEKAIAALRGIPTDDAARGLAARAEEGRLLLQQNRAVEAERVLKEFLTRSAAQSSLSPAERGPSYNQLVYLLSVELRLEDRKPWLEEMHRLGIADVYDSKMLFFPQLLLWHPTSGSVRLAEFLKRDPESLTLRTAAARYELFGGHPETARQQLVSLRNEHPKDLRVASALGEALFEADDWNGIDELIPSLPPPADTDPWPLTHLRGQWALHHRQWDEALLLFRSGIRQDPAASTMVAGESKALERLQKTEEHAAALERTLELSRIRIRLAQVNEHDPDASEGLAEACRRIHFDEAAGVFHAHAVRLRAAPRSKSAPKGPTP